MGKLFSAAGVGQGAFRNDHRSSNGRIPGRIFAYSNGSSSATPTAVLAAGLSTSLFSSVWLPSLVSQAKHRLAHTFDPTSTSHPLRALEAVLTGRYEGVLMLAVGGKLYNLVAGTE